jgi:capsid assembly protease
LSGSYPHIVRLVQETPWAMLPSRLAVLLDLVRFRAAGGRLTDDEIAARIGQRRQPEDERAAAFDIEAGAYRTAQGSSAGRAGVVQVIPIVGTLMPRADLMTETSGGASVERLTARFRTAMADPAVKAVVFDVDSPGGAVSGIPEIASEVYAARGQKPIVAVANTLMASAAFWIGAAADEVVASPSAELGSVGVVAAHEDLSGALAQEGIKVSLIHSGKYKVEGNPFEPLGPDARQHLQSRVDDFGSMFERSVARSRGIAVDAVRRDFGQGRVYGARDAVSRRMADKIGTLDETVRRLARQATTVAPGTAAALMETERVRARTSVGPAPHDLAEIEAAQARARTL